MQLKVLSWNIWFKGDLNGVVQYVKDTNPDIIGMQEVVPERETNILASLKALGYQSAFTSVTELRKDGKKMGNAIFSRHKILSSETFVLSDENRRMAEKVVVDIGGTQLHVFNTHLMHTHQKQSDLQDQQADTLIRLLPKEKALLMGDLNATPESTVVMKMKQVLNNTDLSDAPTWSMYPDGCHTCNPQAIDTRLDYIFTSKDLKTNSPAVGDSKASDHLPISVMVEV